LSPEGKNDTRVEPEPGSVVLFGSGETSPSGRKVFDLLLRGLPASPRVSLIETPAGFELNSSQVIGRIADFLQHRLQGYHPRVTVIPARRRGTSFSPDNPEVVAPLLEADLIFMGPGSPSYAVRQLRDSLAWYYMVARHRLGATLALASAATVAVSAYSLPVYEIYKVGEDLHWKEGLNFFGMFGVPLVFIPHWNNNDGGEELDTSRCYMGKSRFTALMEILPPDLSVLGIDENTALILNLQAGVGRVVGKGGVSLSHAGQARQTMQSSFFPLSECGSFRIKSTKQGIPSEVWEKALESHANLEAERRFVRRPDSGIISMEEAPSDVRNLVTAREEARKRKDWEGADGLREQIKVLGWNLEDTSEGTRLVRG
jgi:cyanophycinase-like exopeptidase